MRPKSANRDLPPRMLRITRVLKNGTVWEVYYYNGRNELYSARSSFRFFKITGTSWSSSFASHF